MSAAVTMPAQTDVCLRPMVDDDYAFVLSSWTKSYVSLMPQHAPSYGHGQWNWIARVARWCVNGGDTLVAYPDGHTDVILGWACVEKATKAATLHYVFVKHEVRRHGIATELLKMLGVAERRDVRMTHRPGKIYRAMAAARGWEYRPLTLQEVERG